ncbi:MAG TPA: RlmE family RNA methyltransferase [Nitrososphaera sp.]|jgi:23S rRNA (uridine2552-2'-O)-methyltransferase
MRLADARKDQYRRLAKDQGYRARSAYKLLQLNKSYHVLKRHAKVVDLGCAPGGWLQVAAKEVGPAGRVVGIDIKPVEPVTGAIVLQGSIEDPAMMEKVAIALDGKADTVLSDLAPNVSGIWEVDHARQISLSTIALNFARQVSRHGGSAVFKVFEGDMLREFRVELGKSFGRVLLSKPSASRQQSSELYIVCLDFRS